MPAYGGQVPSVTLLNRVDLLGTQLYGSLSREAEAQMVAWS